MGETDTARVDVAALLNVARQYEDTADVVAAAVRTHLSALTFDGATAGRAYVAHGDALRAGLDDIGNRLREWARASAEVAAALRASADRYADADVRAGLRVG